MAVYARSGIGLLMAGVGLAVLAAGFEMVARAVDGSGPSEAAALFHAHHPLGGWRPTGRRPGEPTGRPAGGSTKSNTTLSPSSFPTLPGKSGPEGAA